MIATIVLLMLVGWLICAAVMALFSGPEPPQERQVRSAPASAPHRGGAQVSLPPPRTGELVQR